MILTDNKSFPLQPIGVGPVLLAVAVSLLLADILEFYLFTFRTVPTQLHLLVHWSCEVFALIIVFAFLYQPFRLRILQRRELLGALRTSEDQYRTLVEGLDLGIALIDERKQLIKTNRAMNRFVGQPHCLLSDRRCYDLLLHADSGGCQTCPGEQTLATGQPAVTEMHLPDSTDGQVKDVRVSTFPVSAVGSNGVKQFIEVVEDISTEVKTKKELKRLSRALTSAAEEERKRLAQDLHDQCGQVLAGAQYALEALRADVAPELPEVSSHFDRISAMVAQIGQNIRQVSTQLRPSVLDDLGLVATLGWLKDEAQRQNPEMDFTFTTQGLDSVLASEIETAVFRICQESLNNIYKHARASSVSISLISEADTLVLGVVDDGAGFCVEDMLFSTSLTSQIGLRGMRERVQVLGGDLTIRSDPGTGTSIEARVPYLVENNYG